MRIVSLTRESRRSDSSSITATSSFCAGGASSRMDDAAALIEVNGVLNSCARASSSIDFIASFCRAASMRVAVASARARSMTIAARFPIACSAVSDIEALNRQAAHRFTAEAQRQNGQVHLYIVKGRCLQCGVSQLRIGNRKIRRAGFINLVRFAVKNRDAVDCEDLRDALGDLPRCG